MYEYYLQVQVLLSTPVRISEECVRAHSLRRYCNICTNADKIHFLYEYCSRFSFLLLWNIESFLSSAATAVFQVLADAMSTASMWVTHNKINNRSSDKSRELMNTVGKSSFASPVFKTPRPKHGEVNLPYGLLRPFLH